MTVTATQLRKDIYRLFDRVSASGVPLEVTRKGAHFLIVPKKQRSWLDGIKKRDVIKCDPEDLVHMDWSKEWKPFI